MTTVNIAIAAPVDWSQPLPQEPSRHANLSEVLGTVLRGIQQAARGEGTYVDASKLPTEDDE